MRKREGEEARAGAAPEETVADAAMGEKGARLGVEGEPDVRARVDSERREEGEVGEGADERAPGVGR
jgi:hypothetical protein